MALKAKLQIAVRLRQVILRANPPKSVRAKVKAEIRLLKRLAEGVR